MSLLAALGLPNATLVPDAGCASWDDKYECSAWVSVCQHYDDVVVASGTQCCKYGCCITLICM